MRAVSHHFAGLYLGVCGLVSSGLAVALDCPVTPEDPYSVVTGWPLTRSPGAGWNAVGVGTGSTRCGLFINGAVTLNHSAFDMSLGAALALADSTNQTGTYTLETTCAQLVTGSKYAVIRIYKNASNARRAAHAETMSVVADCDVPDPPTEECAEFAGKDSIGLADNEPLDWVPPETACLPYPGVSGGCEAFRKGQLNEGGTRCIPGTDLGCEPVAFSRNDNGDGTANFRWRNEATGQDCSVPDDDVEEIITEGEACNDAYCEGVDGWPGCGYFNDKYICPGDEDGNGDDECYSFDDGTRICAEGTPTPPVPDNGTPGVPAEPDDSIEHCSSSNVCDQTDYYDDETTTGSSRDPGAGTGSGSGPGSGNPVGPGSGGGLGGGFGSGTCSGDGCGEGEGGDESASGGETCSEEPECDGDPIDCAILNQEWRARCPELMDTSDMVETFGATGVGDGESFFGSDTSIEFGAEGGFDGAGFLGGGVETCLNDVEIVLGGDLPTVEIPLSTWCYWMHWLGLFMFVAANVGGIKIVIGGI